MLFYVQVIKRNNKEINSKTSIPRRMLVPRARHVLGRTQLRRKSKQTNGDIFDMQSMDNQRQRTPPKIASAAHLTTAPAHASHTASVIPGRRACAAAQHSGSGTAPPPSVRWSSPG